MTTRSKANKLSVFILISILLCGCVTIYNPATQKNERLLIDTQSEVSMGSDMDKELHKQLKIIDTPVLQERLLRIANRVARSSDRLDLTYQFRIVKDKELNAFACPGGFIYINSGVMDTATDDELACVIAHEVGHVAARHSVKKLQAVLGYQIVMSIALGLSGNINAARALDTVFNVVVLGYSRQDELLADKLAVRYSRKAGFNPRGMISFFQKLQKEAEKQGPDFNLVFLSSHPPIAERIKAVENEINQNP